MLASIWFDLGNIYSIKVNFHLIINIMLFRKLTTLKQKLIGTSKSKNTSEIVQHLKRTQPRFVDGMLDHVFVHNTA